MDQLLAIFVMSPHFVVDVLCKNKIVREILAGVKENSDQNTLIPKKFNPFVYFLNEEVGRKMYLFIVKSILCFFMPFRLLSKDFPL